MSGHISESTEAILIIFSAIDVNVLRSSSKADKDKGPFCVSVPRTFIWQNMMCILPDLRQVSVASLKLTALKRLELCSKTEFDLCDLCDLENQGHDPKTNRVPWGPMGKVYSRFEVDSCKLF